YTPEFFATERNIRVRTNTEALSISHARREIKLAGGERVPYDRLVIATGARRDAPNAAQAFRIDTWDDAERLREFLRDRRPKHAVVGGAGYIGLEIAGALRAQGLRVDIFQKTADVLGREDPWLTAIVARHLERFRVGLHLNRAADPATPCDL